MSGLQSSFYIPNRFRASHSKQKTTYQLNFGKEYLGCETSAFLKELIASYIVIGDIKDCKACRYDGEENKIKRERKNETLQMLTIEFDNRTNYVFIFDRNRYVEIRDYNSELGRIVFKQL